jgi:nucleotide-binding universal stress UspA family protein
MFKKILLPLDVSDRHGPALDVAAELVGASGGELILLHAIEVISGVTMDEEKDFYRRLEKGARDHLGKVGEKMTAKSISWRAEVLYGNRSAEVVRFARERGMDLIVLTAPPFNPQNPTAGLGSLSTQISLLASCPVLLVK